MEGSYSYFLLKRNTILDIVIPTYLQGFSDGVDNVFGFRKLELPGRSLLDPGPDVDLLAVIANNGDLESPTARFLWIDLLFQILDAEARGGGKGRDNTLRFPLEHLSGLAVLDTNLEQNKYFPV